MNNTESYEIKPVKSWQEFESMIQEHKYRQWIYRGQADKEWPLESSYFRFCAYYKDISSARVRTRNKHEKLILEKFKEYAKLYVECVPDKKDDTEWLALMQHHGAPTRLLDWSFSPYVAAYFAVESGKEYFSIYCMKHSELAEMDIKHFKKFAEEKKMIFENISKETRKSFVFAYEPKFKHKRLVAQQGVFTVPSSNYVSYEEILKEYDLEGCFMKMTMKSTLRSEWIRKLHLMNINASTLFPDLDGFCRSIKFDLLHPAAELKRIQ